MQGKDIKNIAIALLAVIFIFSTFGGSQSKAIKTNTDNVDKTIEENLKSIEYPNLNSEDKNKLTMQLKEGWTAKRITWEKPQNYEMNDSKNKSMTETFEYYIYNENKDEIGWFGIIGRYGEDSGFPDHLQLKDVRYKGMTKLGLGKIYFLKLDLPGDKSTNNRNGFYEYYSIVPINNENAAYNFYLKVPDKEKGMDTLELMKDIIVTSEDIEAQVHELYKGDETTSENTEKILNVIPYINWSKYASKNQDEFFKLMTWLGNLKVSNPKDLVYILNSTNGLDASYTDAYCSAVKNLFFNNKDLFITALLDIDDEQLKIISGFICYACEPMEANKVKEYLSNISNSNNEGTREADRIKMFLDAFKAFN